MKFLIVAVLAVAFAGSFAKKIPTILDSDVRRVIDKDSEPFPGYFNDISRQIYDKEHLERQPKWKLAKEQPLDGSYEVREYDPAWYASSHIRCVNQTESASSGYLRLFVYMRKADSLHQKYPLTYPILSKIEFNAEKKALNRSVEEELSQKDLLSIECPDKYTQQFYLPIPVTQTPPRPVDPTITTEIVPAKTFLVRRYEDEFTLQSQASCNIHAGHFALKLTLAGVQFDPTSYYCAMYEPGTRSDVTALFEVWFAAEY